MVHALSPQNRCQEARRIGHGFARFASARLEDSPIDQDKRGRPRIIRNLSRRDQKPLAPGREAHPWTESIQVDSTPQVVAAVDAATACGVRKRLGYA